MSAAPKSETPPEVAAQDDAPSTSGEVSGKCSYAECVVKYPCRMFWGVFVGMIVMTLAAGYAFTNGGGMKTNVANEWSINNNALVQNKDGWDDASSKLDSLEGDTVLVVDFRSEMDTSYAFTLTFATKDESDIFNAASLKEICETESVFMKDANYSKLCFMDYSMCTKEESSFSNCSAALSDPACHTQFSSAALLFYAAKVFECDPGTTCLAYEAYGLSTVEYDGKSYSVGSSPFSRGMCFPEEGTDCASKTFDYTDCSAIDEWKVTLIREWIYDQLDSDSGEWLEFYMSKDTLDGESTKSKRTRSYLVIGNPLEHNIEEADEDEKDSLDEAIYKEFSKSVQQGYFDAFGMKKAFLKSAYIDPAFTDTMDVEFLNFELFYLQFDEMVNEDFMMPIFSIMFVLIWILVHTAWPLVGCCSMFQIFMSLPIAYTFYFYMFRVTFFSQMHILSIFLVLGVGADDVFVLVDAWKQSDDAVPKKIKGDARLMERMKYAYSRTFNAVFNTSFTTAMAFVSTGINPLIGISTFGWFAATAIAVNYLLVITFTPAVIMVSMMYCSPCTDRCCTKICGEEGYAKCRCKTSPKGQKFQNEVKVAQGTSAKSLPKGGESPPDSPTSSVLSNDSDMSNVEPEEEAGGGGCVDNLLSKQYKPCCLKTVKCGQRDVKIVATISTLIFFIFGLQGLYFTTQLTPPTQAERWFPSKHMFTGITDRLQQNYMGGQDDNYVTMDLIFGIAGVDRKATNFDKNEPDENRGNVVWQTDAFDLYPAENQKAFIDFCDAVREKKCEYEGEELEACGGSILVRQDSLVCFLEEFQDWHNTAYGVFPNDTSSVDKETFNDRLILFRETTVPALSDFRGSWENIIGMVDGGNLKYVTLPYRSSLSFNLPLGVKMPLHDMLEEMISDYSESAPAGVGTVFQYCDDWTWMMTEEVLVQSLFKGLAICFPIAFLVLVLATRNYIISLYATLSIGFIVTSMLGACKSFFGWDLGVSESIAGIIVIGFSVDYVVHLGHMYMEAGHLRNIETRDGRFTYAIDKMGGTVVAGAVTTAGSGAVMFLCQVTFFTKMAYLISFTILFSFMFSLGFFMPLCIILGPQNHTGNICECKSKKIEPDNNPKEEIQMEEIK